MSRGGARPGAGRKAGGVNRVTQEAVKAAKKSGLLPLDYLLSVMRDGDADDGKRIDCAKAAAQYLHPKLNAIDLKGELETKIVGEVIFKGLNAND